MSDPAPRFELINPRGLYDPAPNGYSHLAKVSPGTSLVFLAGQGGENEDGALSPEFSVQTAQAFANLESAVRAAGGEMRDVFKLTVLIVDHDEDKLRTLVDAVRTAFGPDHRPACTLIPTPRLALDGMLFEVEGVAAIG